jgi:hypothetical protein
MSALSIFKSSLVNALHSSIRVNLKNYLRDESWIGEVSTKSARDMQTGVVPTETLWLELPENGNLKDTENAIRFHKALRHLTPLQARDPRLWTKLSHVDFWQYMRLRWPIEKHISNQEKAARYIESRYFVAQSQSRALLRNGIARLWWSAQLSHDVERKNPYELTAVLLSTLDITQQILERGMGRANNVTKAFLEFLLRNKDVLLEGGDKNRTRIRRLAKHLNMQGGVSILDCLTVTEIIELLENELTIIRQSESMGEKSAEVTQT